MMRIPALAFLFLGFAACASADQLNTLTVKVEGVSIRGGKLYVGVYTAEAFALGYADPVVEKTVPVKPGAMVVTFVGIATGTYGVKVFQDVNSDGNLNRGGLNFPLEPFGFSNDATPGRSGTVAFRAAQFVVKPGDNKIVVRLRK